ncbi:hypothetical protein BpHYR1_004025 [Brachionus plicatilis]|uniref:Uncharacterized protein n=1 Tax=Brachionus plicatilis TaxID=10195 RepID=A0A3M7T367_BRAPC|nr:hypothetical protein BpHYR1_004025 [Brachionus plicatilis]
MNNFSKDSQPIIENIDDAIPAQDELINVEIGVEINDFNLGIEEEDYGNMVQNSNAKRLNTASRIRLALRERFEQYLPKKFVVDPELPSDLYVPGILIPSNLQINNYLNNTLRPKLQGRNEKAKFSYGDLAGWVESNSIVSDNEHEPFVIDSFIHYNEKYPSTSTIRISFSTGSISKYRLLFYIDIDLK